MRLSTSRITLTKRHALTISRGTIAGSTNVIVEVAADGLVGLGEMAPSDVTRDSADTAEDTILDWAEGLADVQPWERQRVRSVVGDAPHGSAVRAALDCALYDWVGKRAGLPVWQLLGGDSTRIVPTSLTVGINPPALIREIVPEIIVRTGARVLKVKLGQPAGIEADQAMFAAAQEAVATLARPLLWRVDANGGWDVGEALAMMTWLAARGVELVEQPLADGAEAELPALYGRAPMPIIADESVRTSADVAALAGRVHGVNLKLMKCGGIDEALRIIHTARAHGMTVMIGCMGESSLAIGAGAQLASFVDYLDLDSHLNLIDDPFEGVSLTEGVVRPSARPGLGTQRKGAWSP